MLHRPQGNVHAKTHNIFRTLSEILLKQNEWIIRLSLNAFFQ